MGGVSLLPKTFLALHTYCPVSETRTPDTTRLPPSTMRYLQEAVREALKPKVSELRLRI